MLFRGFRAAKILSQQSQAERSRRTQCPGEGSAPTRKRQAFRAGVQVGTPAGQPGLRVRPDYVPSRYKAKQTGLDRTLPAAYTGTHHGHTRGRLLSSYDHSSDKSTVSAGPRHRVRSGRAEPAGLKRQNEPACSPKLTRSPVLLILPMPLGRSEHLQADVSPENLDGRAGVRTPARKVLALTGRRTGARRRT